MKTTFFKSDDRYVVELTVRKIFVEFVGLENYPFCCDIITQDDKHFRCAVGVELIPQFILAQENDELVITMVSVYAQSLVMGVVDFTNLTHHWSSECQNYMAMSFTAKLKFDSAYTIACTNAGNAYQKQGCYHLLTYAPNQYIFFFNSEWSFVRDILAARQGDDVELIISCFAGLELDHFENLSRQTESINSLIHLL